MTTYTRCFDHTGVFYELAIQHAAELQLPKTHVSVVFNPSIIYIQQQYYIACFRTFQSSVTGVVTAPCTIGHPWSSNWSEGDEYTVFVKSTDLKDWSLLRNDDGTLFVGLPNQRDAPPTNINSDTDVGDALFRNIDTRNNTMRDARLYYFNDSVYCTFSDFDGINWDNMNASRENIRLANKMNATAQELTGVDCDSPYPPIIRNYGSQQVLVVALVTFKVNENGDVIKNDTSSHGKMCQRCSESSERNWTLWTNSASKLVVSYHIRPTFSYMLHVNVFGNDKQFKKCDRKNMTNDVSSHLTALEKEHAEKRLLFSLSTPSIKFNETEQLAVGHVKMQHATMTMTSQFVKDLRGREYLNCNKQLYLMFFYTIKNDNMCRLSNFFIIDETAHDDKHTIFFPTGLTLTADNTILLSYGVGDMFCKSAEFTTEQVERMLQTNPKLCKFSHVTPISQLGGEKRAYVKTGSKVRINGSIRCTYKLGRKTFVKWNNAVVNLRDLQKTHAVARIV